MALCRPVPSAERLNTARRVRWSDRLAARAPPSWVESEGKSIRERVLDDPRVHDESLTASSNSIKIKPPVAIADHRLLADPRRRRLGADHHWPGLHPAVRSPLRRGRLVQEPVGNPPKCAVCDAHEKMYSRAAVRTHLFLFPPLSSSWRPAACSGSVEEEGAPPRAV